MKTKMKRLFNKLKSMRFLKQDQYKPLVKLYERQRQESYWYAQQRWQRRKFWLADNIFAIRQWRSLQQDNFLIFRTLIRAIYPQILFALLLVVGLETLENVIRQISAPIITPWLNRIDLNFAAIAGLVFELIGLTGVFLALYFTAITVVASTVYADVTDDVRHLLVEEKFGNLYFKTVALFGVILVLDAGILAFRDELGLFNFIVIILLASFSLLSFLILGIKTLAFFNPTPLLNYLDRDFLKWAQAATPNLTMWDDPSFQNHYQQQAVRALQTYQNVMTLISNRKGIGVLPIKNTANKAMNLLQRYAGLKHQYPTQSRWFRQKGEFPNWLLADSTELRIAISTRTGLRQKAIPDPMWVENELQKTIKRGFEFLLNNHEWELAIHSLNEWQNTLLGMSFQWSIDEARHLFFDARETITALTILPDEQCLQSGDDYEELSLRLGVLDFYHLAFIQIIVGFLQKLENSSVEAFGEKLKNIDWQDKRCVYHAKLPRKAIESLEYLQGSIDLELAAENKPITPIWYTQQLVAANYAQFIVTTVKSLINDIEKLFAEETERLISQNCFIFASQTCSRGIEAIAKGRLCVSVAQKYLDELSIFRKPFGFHLINTKWPDNDWDGMHARLLKMNQTLLISWGKTLPGLSNIPPAKHLPDLFGQAFSLLNDECLNALETGDASLFTQFFKALFVGSHLAFERHQILLQEYEDWAKQKFMIEPFIDVMEVSGYALVYAELKDGNFWEPIKQLWDRFFFDEPEKLEARIEWIATIAHIKSDLSGGTPRDLIRTEWKQRFGRHMRSRGIEDDRVNIHFGGNSELAKFSPIVQRVIGFGSMPSCDLYELFLAVYFDEKVPNTPTLNWPYRIQDIQKSLKRSRQD
jgi:hypothetical protein